jgi:hypothetical protein
MKQILAVFADYLPSHHAEEAFSGLIATENLKILVARDNSVRKPVEDRLQEPGSERTLRLTICQT